MENSIHPPANAISQFRQRARLAYDASSHLTLSPLPHTSHLTPLPSSAGSPQQFTQAPLHIPSKAVASLNSRLLTAMASVGELLYKIRLDLRCSSPSCTSLSISSPPPPSLLCLLQSASCMHASGDLPLSTVDLAEGEQQLHPIIRLLRDPV
jgi:hypothetical protein